MVGDAFARHGATEDRPPAGSIEPAWRTFASSALVIVALISLLLTPLWVQWRTDELRDEIDRAADTDRGRSVLLHVRDTGPGVPPERREAVFDEFSRFPPTPAAGTDSARPPRKSNGPHLKKHSCTPH